MRSGAIRLSDDCLFIDFKLNLINGLHGHPLGAILAIQSAVAGLGALLMDKNLCEPEVKSGALVELGSVEIPFGGYYLVVNKRAGRRKAVRAVREWLLEG